LDLDTTYCKESHNHHPLGPLSLLTTSLPIPFHLSSRILTPRDNNNNIMKTALLSILLTTTVGPQGFGFYHPIG
jgi:hypothetical protein